MILNFWNKSNTLIYGEFVEANKIIFDPRDLIPEISLAILLRDGSDAKFNLVLQHQLITHSRIFMEGRYDKSI